MQATTSRADQPSLWGQHHQRGAEGGRWCWGMGGLESTQELLEIGTETRSTPLPRLH